MTGTNASSRDFEAICAILGVRLDDAVRPPVRRRDAAKALYLVQRLRIAGRRRAVSRSTMASQKAPVRRSGRMHLRIANSTASLTPCRRSSAATSISFALTSVSAGGGLP